MIHAVNLLPESCHIVRRRAMRRSTWTIVVSCGGLLVAGTWIGLQAVNHTLTRLERDLGGVQIKQTELDRQLMFALVERNTLAERARALAALRQDPEAGGLPAQLHELSRRAPEGIVLTELRSVPLDPLTAPLPPVSTPASGTAKSASGAAVPTRRAFGVQISGFAVDHVELTRFIDVVERIPNWEGVELIRAATEPFQNGQALSFRLDCRQREDAK